MFLKYTYLKIITSKPKTFFYDKIKYNLIWFNIMIKSIPEYASEKYKNTVKILNLTEEIQTSIAKGNKALGPIEQLRFKKAHKQLILKEQVLGFLEAISDGKFHTNPFTDEQIRAYTDALLADSPSPFVVEHNKPEVFSRILEIRNSIDKSQDKEAAKQELLRVLYLESTPDINLKNVENLVLAGGGAKALSLAGAVKSLEENGYTPQIQRIAGTSGGAIVAMAYSLGYKADSLKELILNNHFGLFTLGSRFDNGVMNQWAHKFSRNSPSSKLHILSDNTFAHEYHKQLMHELSVTILNSDDQRFKKLKSRLKNSQETPLDALTSALKSMPNKDVLFPHLLSILPGSKIAEIDHAASKSASKKIGVDESVSGNLYKTPKQALINAMRHRSGQDLIRGFFCDVIHESLKKVPVDILKKALYGDTPAGAKHPLRENDMRNISFSQLQNLHKLLPEDFKELHISMSILKKGIRERFTKNGYDPYEHVDASAHNPEFCDLPIADAVRVSMNLPPIYPRYKFKLNGEQYLGSDGGLKSNVSLNTFDSAHPPEKTIGVIYKTSNELRKTIDVRRILALPLSRTEALKSLEKEKELSVQLKQAQKKLDIEIANNKFPGKSATLLQEKNDVLDFRRKNSGVIAELQSALDYFDRANPDAAKTWSTNPLGKIGDVFSRYLDGKSQDDLWKSQNLKRLVMINTKEIETWHFKMTEEVKEQQIGHGEKAMGSLLRGSYCLENHFLYHHITSVREHTSNNIIVKMLNSTIDDSKLQANQPKEPIVISNKEELKTDTSTMNRVNFK